MELKKATKKEIKLRIGLSGASGFGKTYSALLLAYGITNDWTKIVVIDTENGSSSLYSNLGDFNVMKLNAPYSPQNYIDAIKYCEKASMEVIIIDTITPEWKGSGGCLDLHRKAGGKFQDWHKISPLHDLFIDTIQKSTCQVITTVRRKQEYVIDKNQQGRLEVKKFGTKEETRNGWEYEMTLNFELINEQHFVKATKDRTGLFQNKPEFIINSATGRKLKYWMDTGKDLAKVLTQPIGNTG
ncbi:AAA family ATPase [Flagellimonas algicola]|uniref:AAA family ATPase n=1 Tax=Flagellimonas algicola TaxID=2583815 RepID=A0ABY2WIY4_9FLAO|nr:AAA family ATPase [Allomuricauda algicola]TMU54804.1 AAA family ATPase [Allomuricauda algicola]